MTKNAELIAAYWTLAGGDDPRVAEHRSPIDFRRKVEASAKAGFKGMGFWHTDLASLMEHWSLADMKRILDDNGIVHTEVEFLMDWYKTGEEKRRSDEHKRRLLAAAAAFGSLHLKVGDLFRTPVPMPVLTEAFAALCREGAEHGIKVGYEMMPFSIVDSLDKALELITGAGEPNGGVFIDFWHVAKLGIPFEDVARVPLNRITGIELNDGFVASMPDLVLETTDYRQLCGEGEWDVKGFVKTMLDAGYSRPWGVEILSKTLRVLPVEEMAKRAHGTTIAQFPA